MMPHSVSFRNAIGRKSTKVLLNRKHRGQALLPDLFSHWIRNSGIEQSPLPGFLSQNYESNKRTSQEEGLAPALGGTLSERSLSVSRLGSSSRGRPFNRNSCVG